MKTPEHVSILMDEPAAEFGSKKHDFALEEIGKEDSTGKNCRLQQHRHFWLKFYKLLYDGFGRHPVLLCSLWTSVAKYFPADIREEYLELKARLDIADAIMDAFLLRPPNAPPISEQDRASILEMRGQMRSLPADSTDRLAGVKRELMRICDRIKFEPQAAVAGTSASSRSVVHHQQQQQQEQLQAGKRRRKSEGGNKKWYQPAVRL